MGSDAKRAVTLGFVVIAWGENDEPTIVPGSFDEYDDNPRELVLALSGQNPYKRFTLAEVTAADEIDDDDHDPIDDAGDYDGGYSDGSYYDHAMSKDD
ncbi:hypothetical protein [Rhodococcus koreensis]